MSKDLRYYAKRITGVADDWRRYRARIGTVGVAALNYYPGRKPHSRPKAITIRGWSLPVWHRPGTSDLFAFRQIFLEDEYRPIRERLEAPATVLDLGANVGYASLYFLHSYPTCRVVAVEPDPENFALLATNLEPFGDRATLVQKAVWSIETDLTLVSPYTGARHQWARQVAPAGQGDDAIRVRATTVRQILDEQNIDRLDILKMDIEGAEAEVLGDSANWVDRVDCVAIELHDHTPLGDARGPFERCFGNLDIETSGELHIAFRQGTPVASE